MLVNPCKILPAYLKCSFRNFDFTNLANGIPIQQTMSNIDYNNWYFLCGKTGVGKTHCLVSIYKQLAKKFNNAGRRGLEIIWWDRLLLYKEDEIRDILIEKSFSKVLLVDDITKVELMKKLGYNYTVGDMIKNLFNQCFDNNTCLITTSNLVVTKEERTTHLATLLNGDSYLLSRIVSKTIFLSFVGKDYRENL